MSEKNVTETEKYWYLRSIDEVLKETDSSKKGISDEESKKRLEKEGPNSIAKEEKFKILKQFLSEFNNIVLYVLFGASLISYYSGHKIEFYAILIIIFITVFLGFIQEFRAGKAIDALSKLTPKKVYVIRNDKQKEIFSEQLVIGDLVVLKRGMIIPADLRIIQSDGLMINESILTGESIQKPKHSDRIDKQNLEISDRNNIAFAGTSVSGGSGLGIVVEKGFKSELGKISLTLKEIKNEKSPLQRKIDVLGKKISLGVIIISLIFFMILIKKDFTFLDAILIIGLVLVSGVPESFPLAFTLALSNGVSKMAKKNAIIKDLSSVETLGTTTVICTDKTGTLTQNKMVVQKVFFAYGKEYFVKGNGYEPCAKFLENEKVLNEKNLLKNEELFKCSILCSSSKTTFEDGDWVLFGEPTEGSILTMAKSAGFDDEVLREDYLKIYEIPFDPSDKFMITFHQNEKKHYGYLKGAVEKVLEKCSFVRNNDGKIQKITPLIKKKILKKVEEYSKETLRVLALASKKIIDKKFEVNIKNKKQSMKYINHNFVFEGLVGIEDPIRPDVIDSIKECHNAGIKVIMVTGDHRTTAESIAKRLNLIQKNSDKIILGPELEAMTDEELDKIISEVCIFARATPDHKFRIVSSLQRMGEVVAMTGDGVNDAPALKKSDIGVAMGKNGTDVARESANMILADDNFATIVHAVREGRTIYSNIRRFIYYLLTGNFTEVGQIIIAILLGFSMPLTALMILFVNTVTSTFQAMALSIEPTHNKCRCQP